MCACDQWLHQLLSASNGWVACASRFRLNLYLSFSPHVCLQKLWVLFWRLSRLGRVSGGDKKFWWSVRKDITGDLLTSSLAYSGNWRFCHSDWREMVILTSVLYISQYYFRNNLLHLQIYNAVPCLYAICVSRVTNIWDFSLNLLCVCDCVCHCQQCAL